MRLSHPMLSAPIHWRENRVPVLVVEHPKVYRQFVFSLSRQAEGEDGPFVLSLQYEPLDCGECLRVVRDYAALSLDDRKLQNRFQALVQAVVREELAEKTGAQVVQVIGTRFILFRQKKKDSKISLA